MGQHTTVQSLYKRDILQGGYYAVLQPLQVQSKRDILQGGYCVVLQPLQVQS